MSVRPCELYRCNVTQTGSIQAGVSRGRSLVIWTVCCGLAALVLLVYFAASMSAGQGEPIMPLDDVYIHFQYARQLAVGQPYVYNPGLPPTSGATSFLYPYILAIGALLGFQGLWLGLWAMIVGALALAGSGWLVYRLTRASLGDGLAGLLAAALILSGPVSWHFMSGMETGLVILFALLTLFGLMRDHQRTAVFGATLLTLIRPEGGALAAIAMTVLALRHLCGVGFACSHAGKANSTIKELLPLAIPLLALGAQPLVNLLVTGSAVASGNSAKSLFGLIPPDLGVILSRIVDNWLRMWRELITGVSAREGVLVLPLLSLLAVFGVGSLLLRRDRRWIGLVLIGWFVVGTAAIATLDTAFWHFKRYQMPLIALLFPLAGWGLALLLRAGLGRRLIGATIVLTAAVSVWTGGQFLTHYALNVGYVAAQPLLMADWLRANTEPDDVIAVHDVGMMRYRGQRTTLDMVGLTTAGAADYWRNGPGAVGELLLRERPDWIASYGHGHGYGLGYLEDTDLFAEAQARYTVALDQRFNVALAADTQGIYRPAWEAGDRAAEVRVISGITPYLRGMERVDAVNVADIESESAHAYRWSAYGPLGGFPTEFYQFPVIGCLGEPCRLMDGGRRISGEESFTLDTQPGEDLILVTRLHPAHGGMLDVYADDTFIATRVVPELAGGWLEIASLIPGAQVGEAVAIRIAPQLTGDYMPYHHWAYQGAYTAEAPSTAGLAAYQDGAITLQEMTTSIEVRDDGTRWLEIRPQWATDGRARGDYKVFVHVLDGARSAILAQGDSRPGRGALPPGNWLPGAFRDTISLNISDLTPGTYPIALGLYDPLTDERLTPTALDGVEADHANRLFVELLEID